MKKILSIDGGGIRGIIPAIILDAIEQKTDQRIHEIFDLIAGTSTGGILALGLSMQNESGDPKYRAGELAEIYERRGSEIFDRSSWQNVLSVVSDKLHPRVGAWISGAAKTASIVENILEEKYSHQGLERVLESCFENATLGNALSDILIPCYDIEARRPFFLRSWEPKHRTVSIRDAARATSAAPTYFEPHSLRVGNRTLTLIDGGVFVNTPVVSAYAEAREKYGKEEFFVLSIGTGKLTREIEYEKAKDWGIAEWALPLLYCIFDGVSEAADSQMQNIIDDSETYIRLQPRLSRGRGNDDMDDTTRENIDRLINLANDFINDDADFKRVCELLSPEEKSSQ